MKGRKERKGGKGKREENSEKKKAKGEIIRSKGRTERKKEEKLGQRIFSFRTRWLSLLLPPPSPALDRSGARIYRLWISSIIKNMRVCHMSTSTFYILFEYLNISYRLLSIDTMYLIDYFYRFWFSGSIQVCASFRRSLKIMN